MRVHLAPTCDNDFPYAILKMCSKGEYGYIVWGDSRENCIKIAREQGYRVFDDILQMEVSE